LRVPEDISVVGYDDHDFASTIGLTTISQPVQFLGQLAASQIMAKIEKPESTTAQMKVPISLVIRESVRDIT
jgi:DNA-binding LacI/PurR family transcriptional regulator